MAFSPFTPRARHALAFSDTAVSLMRLSGGRWTVLDRVPLDAPDFGGRAASLREKAGTGTVALWLPPGHVVSLRVPGYGAVDAAAAVAARTGLAPDSLTVATWAQRSTGDWLIFAADRDTVGEALAYARGWGFEPVAVTIHPDSAPEGCRIGFPHPDLPRPGFGWPVAAAAAVLLALGIGGAWMLQTPPEPPAAPVETAQAPQPAPPIDAPPVPTQAPGDDAAKAPVAPATPPPPAAPAPLAAVPEPSPVPTAPAPPERTAALAEPRIELPALAPLEALRGLPPPVPARRTPEPRLAALPPASAPPESPLPPSAAARAAAPGAPAAPPPGGTPPAIVPALPDAPPDSAVNPAAEPLPPAVAALGALLPSPRPEDETAGRTPAAPPPPAGTDAGTGLPADLAAAHPVPRPAGLVAYPRVAPETGATAQADAQALTAPRPAVRPRTLMVRREIAATRMGSGAAATSAGPRTVTATRQDVAQAATVRGALKPGETGLLGVFGQGSDRQALLRLPDGQIRRVKKGDRIEGWTVSVIDDGSVRLSGSGGSRTLRVPVP